MHATCFQTYKLHFLYCEVFGKSSCHDVWNDPFRQVPMSQRNLLPHFQCTSSWREMLLLRIGTYLQNYNVSSSQRTVTLMVTHVSQKPVTNITKIAVCFSESHNPPTRIQCQNPENVCIHLCSETMKLEKPKIFYSVIHSF